VLFSRLRLVLHCIGPFWAPLSRATPGVPPTLILACLSPLLAWRPSAMGHPSTVVILPGVTTRTAYPGSCPAHSSASDRSRRPAPTRTSLASHRVSFLAASAKVTEILYDSTTSNPAGFVITNPYRHWHLTALASTPPRSCILRHPSPVRTHMWASLRRTCCFSRSLVATSLTRRPPDSLSLAELIATPTLAHSRLVYQTSQLFRTLSKFIARRIPISLLCRDGCSDFPGPAHSSRCMHTSRRTPVLALLSPT